MYCNSVPKYQNCYIVDYGIVVTYVPLFIICFLCHSCHETNVILMLSPQKKTNTVKEKIKKKYEDMKRVLDEDLRITLTQLDVEHEATEKLLEERIEDCYHLTQELEQQMSSISAQIKRQEADIQVNT